MALKRRQFLNRSGMLLAGLGLSEVAWWQLGDRYQQAIAQPNHRKLALLVGINQYPKVSQRHIEPLSGCVTDVELQRELLIGRFGFNPSDILALTDKEATRENIETSFIEHLINQAQPGDLVVFHYSGYGSHVADTNQNPDEPTIKHSLIPVDVTQDRMGEPINDIMEDTLWLLLRSLRTQQVVTILDTSYVYPGYSQQGVLRIRTAASPNSRQISDRTITRQQELLQRRQIDPKELEQRRRGELPGIVLAASTPTQIATETNWSGLRAGLFTYSLTQTLWNATATSDLKESLGRVAGAVERITGPNQQPQLQRQGRMTEDSPSPMIKLPLKSPPVDGIVTTVTGDGKSTELLLAGLPGCVLESGDVNSLFAIVPNTESTESKVLPKLQIRGYNSLHATAEVLTLEVGGIKSPAVESGQFIKETIRVLPRHIDLKIGLDPQLDRIERVDATSALSSVADVSITSNDQPMDYLLSRVRDTTIAQNSTAPLNSLFQGHYGLFSPGQVVLPDTAGEGGEAVKVAVQRLVPQLKTRLAAKLLRLTENERSDLLKAKVTLAMLTPQSRAIAKRETPDLSHQGTEQLILNASNHSNSTPGLAHRSETFGIPTIPKESRIQMQLQNNGELPLYFIMFLFDSRGQTYVYDATRPPIVETEDSSMILPQVLRVEAGKTMSIPPANVNGGTSNTETLGELVRGPAGLIETYLIISHYPFTQTLPAISRGLKPTSISSPNGLQLLSNPLEVSRAVLEDLAKASKLGVERSGISTDNLALDVNAWATFNFVCRVV
ncbi:caspase family protein [Limnospira fusiformis KN01]|uniref:caspase family protein n=1 Tax=Limnospira fusiformis TaxID=54297 RepID=UPI001658A628|nr:caspase family protein [Limnospira fusiformis]ULB45805.1 caspase family protein [Limnospira fusiformis KN01]